jgi:hypothetical protein
MSGPPPRIRGARASGAKKPRRRRRTRESFRMNTTEFRQMESAWIAAGPPAPLSAGDASWVIALPILAIMLLMLLQDTRS